MLRINDEVFSPKGDVQILSPRLREESGRGGRKRVTASILSDILWA